MDKKISLINALLTKLEKVIVAFSGGVDSSVLLKLAYDCLGKENVLAVTAIGSMYPSEEKLQAQKIAKIVGAKLIFCENPAMNNTEFLANTSLRCYYCKKAIMGHLKKLAKEQGYNAVIAGENADDVSDYRPGHKAIEELGIICPLQEAKLTKTEIREIARKIGLPNWNIPANPCLVTRVAYGDVLDCVLLKKIDKAETFIRQLGFDVVRVRVHKEIARIEVLSKDIEKLVRDDFRKKIVEKLSELGFLYISADLKGYRMGSVNEMIAKQIDNNRR